MSETQLVLLKIFLSGIGLFGLVTLFKTVSWMFHKLPTALAFFIWLVGFWHTIQFFVLLFGIVTNTNQSLYIGSAFLVIIIYVAGLLHGYAEKNDG